MSLHISYVHFFVAFHSKVEYKNKQVYLSVDLKKPEFLIELGIAKAHYCLVNGGKFEWGNGQPHQSNVL